MFRPKLISCYISCTFVNFHFNFTSVVVWRSGDGAPLPLSPPNPSKNKGGRTGEQGKVGFHQKPPKSIKKSFKIIIGFAPRRFGVFCAHTRGRRIEFPLFPRTPALSRASQVALFGGAKPPSQPTHIHYWPRPPLAFCSIVFIRPLRVRSVLTIPDDFLLARGRSATRRPCNALGGGAKKTMPALLVETGEAGQHWETVQL